MLQVSITSRGDYSEISSFYLSVEIGPRECWCIPYTSLARLYAQAGFEETHNDTEPGFLLERLARYEIKGKPVVLLVRQENCRRQNRKRNKWNC